MRDIRFARAAPVRTSGAAGPTTPGEIWTLDCRTEQARQVVSPNAAGMLLDRLATPSLVRFAARDGVPLSGLLYTPRAARGRQPVFLRLHGGPSSHARADWKPDVQYLVARGIAVLAFNYRGSTGAGRTVAMLNDKRLRPNEIGDLLDAVAWIKRQPGLDGARIAVGGASYGGYLTNAVVGRHPGVFVAAVSEVGVADWPRNLRNASPQLKASDRLEYGDIDDPSDAAFFASISPMNDAARVRTPMLVQAGANDPRNGADELDAYVRAIRAGGGAVSYRRYENEGHVLRDLADIADSTRPKAAFLPQHCRRRSGGAATGAHAATSNGAGYADPADVIVQCRVLGPLARPEVDRVSRRSGCRTGSRDPNAGRPARRRCRSGPTGGYSRGAPGDSGHSR